MTFPTKITPYDPYQLKKFENFEILGFGLWVWPSIFFWPLKVFWDLWCLRSPVVCKNHISQVTQPMLQLRPNPTELRSMDYYHQIFCVVPKIYLHIVPVTNILCQNKRWFAFSKIVFCAGTKVFEEALNAVKFLGWLKKFGLAQNILDL